MRPRATPKHFRAERARFRRAPGRSHRALARAHRVRVRPRHEQAPADLEPVRPARSRSEPGLLGLGAPWRDRLGQAHVRPWRLKTSGTTLGGGPPRRRTPGTARRACQGTNPQREPCAGGGRVPSDGFQAGARIPRGMRRTCADRFGTRGARHLRGSANRAFTETIPCCEGATFQRRNARCQRATSALFTRRSQARATMRG